MINLQDKLDVIPPQSTSSASLDPRDCSPQAGDGQSSGLRSPHANSSSREREILGKGIERLEKQILQLIGVFISQDQVNIALLKKCKTVDVPAVNSAIGNVQKALQKYVGFTGMESDYCDRIGDFMEELYNKAEVHSINTSKGYPLRVKNTHIQSVLIRVLPSGVGVYLSPFKDVGGSRVIFVGPSNIFTQANKDQQRESNYAVYSLHNSDILGGSVNCRVGGDDRFDSNSKMKTSAPKESSKEEVNVSCNNYVISLSKNIPVIYSVVSAELARVQAQVEFDLEIQNIDLAEIKIKEGSRNKIDVFGSNIPKNMFCV